MEDWTLSKISDTPAFGTAVSKVSCNWCREVDEGTTIGVRMFIILQYTDAALYPEADLDESCFREGGGCFNGVFSIQWLFMMVLGGFTAIRSYEKHFVERGGVGGSRRAIRLPVGEGSNDTVQ